MFGPLITPQFPRLSGPHQVGSIDVEIPVTELDSQACSSSADVFAEPEDEIKTIQYRIYYPCQPSVDTPYHADYWTPSPQRQYVASLAMFLGIGRWASDILS